MSTEQIDLGEKMAMISAIINSQLVADMVVKGVALEAIEDFIAGKISLLPEVKPIKIIERGENITRIRMPVVFGDCPFENQALVDFNQIFPKSSDKSKNIRRINDVYLALADEYLKDTSQQHLHKYLRYKIETDMDT